MKPDKWIERGLALVILISGILIAATNDYGVLQWFQTDDAFYYFKVAENIGNGLGSTFDGVNLTNGYHPLWLLVCIPVFLLARVDLLLPLRGIILISAGLSAASAVLLFRMLRRYIEMPIALLVTVLWSMSTSFFRLNTMGGMETPISIFFIIWLWERVTALNQQETVTLRQIISVGIIAVFTFLSRLDNIFLVFFAGVWLWVRWWRPGELPRSSREAWKWRLQTGFAYYLPVTVVLLAYLGINQWLFGTAMPVSSEVKLWWGTLGLTIYGAPLYIYTDYLFEYLLPASRGEGPWTLVTRPLHTFAIQFWKQRGRNFTFEPLVLTYASVFAVLGAVLLPGWKQLRKLIAQLGLLPFFVAAMVHSIYYFWRDSYNLRPWYWTTQNLFLLIFLGVALSVIFRYFKPTRTAHISLAIAGGALSILVVSIFGTYIYQKTYPGYKDIPHLYQERADVIRTLIPEDAVISAIGSGSIGYFLPEYRVVNLDGLINSIEYFEDLKAGRVIDFMVENHVEYVIGDPYLVTVARPYGDNLADHLEFYTEFEFSIYSRTIWKVIPPS